MSAPDYFVVQDHDKEKFESAVAFNLRRGWKLVGGVFMTRMPMYDGGAERLFYCQAMTKGGKGA